MSGACPFAAQWRRAEEATAVAKGSPETCGTRTDNNNSTSTSTTPTSCPAGFGVAAGTCPLGFGSNRSPSAASFAGRGLPRMPLAVLAGHHHHDDGTSASAGVRLVSVKGVVFDVSGDAAFASGGRLARLPGHDASRLIALSTTTEGSGPFSGKGEGEGEGGGGGDGRGDDDDLDAGLSGLRYEEHQRLETYFVEMARGRRAVAVLADVDHVRIFGAPLGGGPRAATSPTAAPGQVEAGLSSLSSSRPLLPPPSEVAELHASVEQGDAEAVAQLLRRQREAGREGAAEQGGYGKGMGEGEGMRLVDCPCPRTGMTPLLKAVEVGSGEMARLLLEAGADVRSKAALYDGDNAVALARRLGSRDAIVDMLLAFSSP